MFKSSFYKLPPKKVIYRNLNNFDQELFTTEVSKMLSIYPNIYHYENFEFCLKSILNKHAPLKVKLIRGNDKPFISKRVRKEIFMRSRFKNTFNKTGLESDWNRYKKQRNYVCGLIKKEKKSFFSNIKINSNEKDFWKACKPFLVNKSITANERLVLNNDGMLMSNEYDVVRIFNLYFSNILSTLDITHWNPINLISRVSNSNLLYPEYNNHPSIIKIKNYYRYEEKFKFKHVEPKQVFDIINKLKKGSGEIPIYILKLIKTTCTSYITDCINTSINNCTFPKELKWADILPIYKKGDTYEKENYRPISILPTISKVFERAIFDQIDEFMQNKFF